MYTNAPNERDTEGNPVLEDLDMQKQRIKTAVTMHLTACHLLSYKLYNYQASSFEMRIHVDQRRTYEAVPHTLSCN